MAVTGRCRVKPERAFLVEVTECDDHVVLVADGRLQMMNCGAEQGDEQALAKVG
jgi:hypothetical protein